MAALRDAATHQDADLHRPVLGLLRSGKRYRAQRSACDQQLPSVNLGHPKLLRSS
jgi:hypothetical protein